ncbi:hypothetical protein OSTOST_01739 [Ostertagia ostertagi]
MITLKFARTLFAFTFFGAFTDLQMMLFSALPGPLSNLYNQTFIRHYGIQLDSTVCILGLSSCAFQGFGGWFGSAELFIVGQLLLGLSIPIKLVVVSLFVTECAPDKHRGMFWSLMLSWLSTLLVTPLTFLSTFAIDKFGRRPVVFIAATIIFLKILIMFAAQMLVFVISPSWITMTMATANEFASDLISCTGAGAVASLLIAELVPPAARVAVLLFVPLASTVPTMTSFPVLNAIFAPAVYVPMLICQPFLIGYLIRQTRVSRSRKTHRS